MQDDAIRTARTHSALSYKHIENFTKDLEVTRGLGNRASPVNQAHVKRPLSIPLYIYTHTKVYITITMIYTDQYI